MCNPCFIIAAHWIALTLLGICIYGIGGHGFQGSFGWVPKTRAGWIAYWFHTLEFLMASGLYFVSLLGWRISTYPGYAVVPWVVLFSLLFLMASSIAFWRTQPASAKAGLIWLCLILAGFLLLELSSGVRY